MPGIMPARYAPIAQLDRALPSGGRGRGFESLWAHQINKKATLAVAFLFISVQHGENTRGSTKRAAFCNEPHRGEAP